MATTNQQQSVRIPAAFVPVLRAEIRESLALPSEPSTDAAEQESSVRYARALRDMRDALADDGTSSDRTLTLDVGQHGTGALRDKLMHTARETLTYAIANGPDRSWVPAAFAGWADVADQLDAIEAA